MHLLRKIIGLLFSISALASVARPEALPSVRIRAQVATVLDATQDWFEPGEAIANQFGSAFAAGDINGDGYSDLVVGAPGYGPVPIGRIYIYYGSESGLVHPSPDRFYIMGDITGSATYFGSSIACSDLNGDGYGDVIVGEYGLSSN